jgi:DNA polymerase-3 subunit alpha
MEQAQAAQRDRLSGQISLFTVMPEQQVNRASSIELPDLPEWTEKEKLAYEKETVGFYITGHPLDNYRREIREVADTDIGGLAEWGDNQPVRVGGLVRECKEHRSKKGERMAFVILEDTAAAVEVVIFPEAFARSSHLLVGVEPLIVLGTLKKEERGVKIIAESVDSLPEARSKYTCATRILLRAGRINRQQMENLRTRVREFHGSCPVFLTLHFEGRGEVDIDPPVDFTVRPGQEFSEAVERTLGYAAVHYQKTATEIQPRNNGRNNGWQRNGNG